MSRASAIASTARRQRSRADAGGSPLTQRCAVRRSAAARLPDIEPSTNGIVVKIDLAMGLHEGSANGVSPGALLHLSTKSHDTAEVLDAKGHASEVPSL